MSVEVMKAIVFVHCLLGMASLAGETAVTYTYQVLCGLGAGSARIEKVYCVDQYAQSGMPTAFQLIAAPNKPPTNAPTPIEDINLVSASGLKVDIVEKDKRTKISIDATKLALPKRFDLAQDELLKALLECIRRTAALHEIKGYEVTIRPSGDMKIQAETLLEAFRSHSKSKPFWIPEN